MVALPPPGPVIVSVGRKRRTRQLKWKRIKSVTSTQNYRVFFFLLQVVVRYFLMSA